jgi:ABC-2 type transport system permease protein
MKELSDMIWIESRKALKSRIPLWTLLGSLFIPLAIAFLIFVARNPELSKKLGLIGAKANLVAYAATDWQAFIGFIGLFIAAGGFFLSVLIVSWVFGREFMDGTLKDMLAVPVRRLNIVLAKYILAAVWSAALTLVMILVGLVMGAVIQMPGASVGVIVQGCLLAGMTGVLTMLVVTPFAFLASAGRGYLLPMSIAALTLMMANLVALTGRGEYFPWAVPGIFAQGKTLLPAISYWIVFFTGAGGMAATYGWWMNADQNR